MSSSDVEVTQFQKGDRVRVMIGIDRNRCGEIVHVGGEVGTYYGLLLDDHPRALGYCQYELEPENENSKNT